jgi:hypothetical protein
MAYCSRVGSLQLHSASLGNSDICWEIPLIGPKWTRHPVPDPRKPIDGFSATSRIPTARGAGTAYDWAWTTLPLWLSPV